MARAIRLDAGTGVSPQAYIYKGEIFCYLVLDYDYSSVIVKRHQPESSRGFVAYARIVKQTNRRNILVKESIIKISKPIPKVQPQPSESEIESNLTETQELSSHEELPCPEPEPIDMAEQGLMRFASAHSHGWKVSDILREIRLDNFEMGGED